MHITNVIIQNFKCFQGKFEIELNPNLNILVGDNECGKSTILQAINLALNGWIHGRYIKTELKESLFNKKVVEQFLKEINAGGTPKMPEIIIELHCDFKESAINSDFSGDFHFKKEEQRTATGVRFSINFDEELSGEFIKEVKRSSDDIYSLPIEYCQYKWETFSREVKIPRSIPLKASLIDSSDFRYSNGSEVSASKIVRDGLTTEEEIKISQAHRKLRDIFGQDPSVQKINEKIQQNLSSKNVTLQIETSTKTSWENSLTTYLNNIPFQNIGKGEQCLVKTKLSLNHRKTKKSNILLLEEPENHLSHTKLNTLLKFIKHNNSQKQIIVSTHNSFVANKLGLSKLVLLNVVEKTNQRHSFKIEQLNKQTQEYFEKLPGYNTLRLILCKKAVLVEGPSEELLIQKAYLDKHGHLPIEDEVDIISVNGLSFKRFLDIATLINQEVVVVTDNDGDFENNISQKYSAYQNQSTIKICADNNNKLETLEPQFVEANKNNLTSLREVLGIKEADYPEQKDIVKYLKNNKTSSALKIFKTDKNLMFPKYILDAIQ